jgi:hypothetical protein
VNLGCSHFVDGKGFRFGIQMNMMEGNLVYFVRSPTSHRKMHTLAEQFCKG